jgi:hypothetical protein
MTTEAIAIGYRANATYVQAWTYFCRLNARAFEKGLPSIGDVATAR